MIDKRIMKCCPFCGSTNIAPHIRDQNTHCGKCKRTFPRQLAVNREAQLLWTRFPPTLLRIMEKKKAKQSRIRRNSI